MGKGNKNNKPEVEENSTEEKKFVNPFEKGVTYAMFLEALGDQSIADYCKDNLSIMEIDWLEREIESHKLNNK